MPSHVDSHLIVDNYCIHQRGKGKEWLGQQPRFHLHLTPTYGSWIKQVGRCCGSRSQNPMDVVPAPALESSPARSIMTLWSPATPQPVPLSGWPPIQPGQDPTPLDFFVLSPGRFTRQSFQKHHKVQVCSTPFQAGVAHPQAGCHALLRLSRAFSNGNTGNSSATWAPAGRLPSGQFCAHRSTGTHVRFWPSPVLWRFGLPSLGVPSLWGGFS